MIRVLLAEDHETVREGLRLLLDAQPDMKVVAEARDGRVTLERAREVRPDIVVLDITMPNMNGLVAARALRASVPEAIIVALTRHADRAYVQELLSAGAAAYVLKQSPSTELINAIRAAVSGNQYVDRAILELDETAARGPGKAPAATDREREVLRRMALGQSNKEIANDLGISVKTVEVHKANAMRKLALRGRTDVVRYAVLNGWLQEP